MAVDTRNKRMGMVGLGLPFGRVSPDPDGTVGDPDRAQLLFLYPGVALDRDDVTLESGGSITRAGLEVTAILEPIRSTIFWLNNGCEYLILRNASASSVTLTLDYQAQYNRDDPSGRTVIVGAGKTAILGPFPQVLYNDSSQRASVICSATSSITAAVVRTG
jgi:hypothetical protein